MVSLVNNAVFVAASSGTGAFVVSAARTGYQTPAAVGATDGKTYAYRAESNDKTEWERGTTVASSTATSFTRVVEASSAGGTTTVNFTNPPTVALVPRMEDILQFDDAMSLTATQQLMGRTNLGFSTEVGKIEWWPTSKLQAGRLKANGASFLRATYPILAAYLIRSGAATFTNGSPNVGMTAHELSFGDPVKLFTAGSLPTNFTASTHGLPTVGTNYFVKTVVNANTVTLSATVGGVAISAGSAGSGAHTWVNAPHGDGDGSTTATVPDLRGNFIRGWNDDAAIDANRSIGNLQLDALQSHKHTNAFVYGLDATGTQIAGGSGVNLLPAGMGGPVDDGVGGTSRTATETRPRNVSMMPTIRYSA